VKLEFEKVSKRYRRSILALDSFSLDLKPGVLGLLGPNGAGKTTLMSILATITKATEGRVLWNGVDVARDFAGLIAWTAGALFIPALALVLGVATGSRKFFEALYTAWWYVGPLHHIRNLDFMGTTAASSTPAAYLAAAALLVLAAYSLRKLRLAYA
jgi:ABC-type cobalamin/Fe3+-siderophores transport system ATPase subunit